MFTVEHAILCSGFCIVIVMMMSISFIFYLYFMIFIWPVSRDFLPPVFLSSAHFVEISDYLAATSIYCSTLQWSQSSVKKLEP